MVLVPTVGFTSTQISTAPEPALDCRPTKVSDWEPNLTLVTEATAPSMATSTKSARSVPAATVWLHANEVELPAGVEEDEAVPLVVMASTPRHCPCPLSSSSCRASMPPVHRSSCQLPPCAAPPVRSTEAATSTPVSWARDSMSCSPSDPAATSQP